MTGQAKICEQGKYTCSYITQDLRHRTCPTCKTPLTTINVYSWQKKPHKGGVRWEQGVRT